MGLTGSLLGGFLLVHAAGNSSIFMGRTAFLSYAKHLHSLGFLITIAELSLALVFLLHVFVGLLLLWENYSARTKRYAIQVSAGGRSWGSATMGYTGPIVLVFIVVHLLNFHFTAQTHPIADIVAEVLGQPLYFILYFIGITALGLHLSHGFQSVFQTFGLNHPLYDKFIKNSSIAVTAIIFMVFTVILLLLLLNNHFLTP